LSYNDGNLYIKGTNIQEYDAFNMSDGEKSILYLSAYILLAPQNSFIIIDEPELHLHKSIIDKIFNKLEKERKDCTFIYITHDIDFAASRYNAKKFWLKSFKIENTNLNLKNTSPDFYKNLEIESVKENEIPQELYLKLLGCKKPILFCEGKKDSWDAIIYEKIYGDKFTITPVGGCKEVENYTKTFNKINKDNKGFGIIDSDFNVDNKDYKEKLKENNIYVIEYPGIENLLLTRDFLQKFKDNDGNISNNNCIEELEKEIKKKYANEIEEQAKKYKSKEIERDFKEKNGKI
jgi:hypothetical protein